MAVITNIFETEIYIFYKIYINVCLPHTSAVAYKVIWTTWVDWGDLELVVKHMVCRIVQLKPTG